MILPGNEADFCPLGQMIYVAQDYTKFVSCANRFESKIQIKGCLLPALCFSERTREINHNRYSWNSEAIRWPASFLKRIAQPLFFSKSLTWIKKAWTSSFFPGLFLHFYTELAWNMGYLNLLGCHLAISQSWASYHTSSERGETGLVADSKILTNAQQINILQYYFWVVLWSSKWAQHLGLPQSCTVGTQRGRGQGRVWGRFGD